MFTTVRCLVVQRSSYAHCLTNTLPLIESELVVITGCSSGLGRETVKNLLATDKYHVIGAVRDIDKMEAVAEIDGFNMDNFHIIECELNSFDSVHKFCDELKEYQMAKPVDRLICNAGGTRSNLVSCNA